jgi:hypothetical protein
VSTWDTLFGRRPRLPGRATCRPSVEALEPRDVPATMSMPTSLGMPSIPLTNNLAGFASAAAMTSMLPAVGTAVQTATAAVAVSPFLGASGNPALGNLVNSLFVGLLHRPADAVGLNAFVSQLSVGVPLQSIAQQIAASPEALSAQVSLLYTELLHRAPDAAGLASNVQLLSQGGAQAVLTAFVNSPEFQQLAAANGGAISTLYQGLLGRIPAASEIANWNGMSLPAVAIAIADSAEFNRPLIEAEFQTILGRAADPTGLQNLLSRIGTGALDATGAAVALIASPEFQSRFGF